MGEAFDKVRGLYGLLQDDLSRNVFWARMRYDCEPNEANNQKLSELYDELALRQQTQSMKWSQELDRLKQKLREWKSSNVFIYGAGYSGTTIGSNLLKNGIDFCGYCDRDADLFTHGVQDKPIYPEAELLKHKEDGYVILGVSHKRGGYEEAIRFLRQISFPEERIWTFYRELDMVDLLSPTYFQLPQYFRDGTAFVDCGCYNGETSLYFAQKFAGHYSNIFAFEPEPNNYRRCKDYLSGADRAQVFRIALADRKGKLAMYETSDQNAYLDLKDGKAYHAYNPVFTMKPHECIETDIDTLDHLLGEEPIGYIKVETMGAELLTLQGAAGILKRDKPVIAVKIHHRPGDMVEIMDYLHQIVPEYRFWLRQYYPAPAMGLLYAAAAQ